MIEIEYLIQFKLKLKIVSHFIRGVILDEKIIDTKRYRYQKIFQLKFDSLYWIDLKFSNKR